MKPALRDIVQNRLKPSPAKLFFIGLVALGWGLMIFHPVHLATHHHEGAGLLLGPAFIQALSMWLIMVLAMMVPTLSPVFDTPNSGTLKLGFMVKFIIGYLLAWTGFCVAATFLQAGLRSRYLLDMQMSSTTPWFSAVLLVGAGLYQFTNRKKAYLISCQLSLKRLKSSPGQPGLALGKGLDYGVDCIKCCWPMMLTMFVFGLMNIYAMAALTVLMIAEKASKNADILAKISGLALVGLGVGILLF